MNVPRRRTAVMIALSVAASPALAKADATAAGCSGEFIPPLASERRALTADDLLRLRDIGSNGETGSDVAAIALSPDRRKLAFQLRRADPDRNSYCLAMFVLDLAPGARPRMIDIGGQPIRASHDFRGKAGFPTGIMASIVPRWTRQGDAILFLKRTGNGVQIWRAAADGTGSGAVTTSPDDIVDFSLDADRSILRFTTRPGLRQGRQSIAIEGLVGFRFDDRFSPMSSNRPFVPAPAAEQAWLLSLRPGKAAVPTTAAANDVAPNIAAHGPGGRSAWMEFDHAAFPPSATLQVRMKGGSAISCRAVACDRKTSGIWWTPRGRLRFFRREGWGDEATAVYEWLPGKGEPRRLMTTRDVLSSCIADGEDIICVREASARPRYIVRIDVTTGRQTTLFDPNPEFQALRLGRVERLHWRSRDGMEVFGDLVLPVDYRPGHRYPLIIVQYDSRGFLRGGTGDEYPIQLFAGHGYAVLSFNRPPDFGLRHGARTVAEAERINLRDFADRRSVYSALERGISMVVERGIVDPKRVGITGLSDGASTAQFALLNSDLFRAAALSSCCWDASLAWRVGPQSMRDFSAMGYPGALTDHEPFWESISIARNAVRFRTPLLLQLADSEYLAGITAVTALRAQSAPVDLYVFPAETHIKWQPAHRRAIYRRSLAWFDWWLKPKPDVVLPDEAHHWNALGKVFGDAAASRQ